jgi:hypothetical protein
VTRFCANCGTEVDDGAAFCPTCGQPLDEAAELQMPPAPSWPESELPDASAAGEPAPPGDAATPWPDAPSRPQPAPEPATQPVAAPTSAPPSPAPSWDAPPPPASASPSAPAGIDLPITWPVTLSGWLIGGGAAVGAFGALVNLFGRSVIAWDVILLLLLLAIALTVFLAATVPAIPHLRLATMVIVLIGLGIALDRIGLGSTRIGSMLMLLGTLAASIGAIILELGRDQPLGGPRG